MDEQIEKSNKLYRDFLQNFTYIDNIAEFPTRFGNLSIKLMRKIKDNKQYIVKEFQTKDENTLTPLIAFLNCHEVFQDVESNLYNIVPILQRFKHKNPQNLMHSLFIVQKSYNSFKLSIFRSRKKTIPEIEVFTILREIAKFYSLLLKTPFANDLLHANFLAGLNSNSIFYYPNNCENKPKKIKHDRLKIDFLDFVEEPVKSRRSSLSRLSSTVISRSESKIFNSNFPDNSKLILDKLHLKEFGGLIIELLFNASLFPGPDREKDPVKIESLIKRIGKSMKTLFVKINQSTKGNNDVLWNEVFKNPIMNQDLERKFDLVCWKFQGLDSVRFQMTEVYKYFKKRGSNDDESIKNEKNKLGTHYSNKDLEEENLKEEDEGENLDFKKKKNLTSGVNASKNIGEYTKNYEKNDGTDLKKTEYNTYRTIEKSDIKKNENNYIMVKSSVRNPNFDNSKMNHIDNSIGIEIQIDHLNKISCIEKASKGVMTNETNSETIYKEINNIKLKIDGIQKSSLRYYANKNIDENKKIVELYKKLLNEMRKLLDFIKKPFIPNDSSEYKKYVLVQKEYLNLRENPWLKEKIKLLYKD